MKDKFYCANKLKKFSSLQQLIDGESRRRMKKKSRIIQVRLESSLVALRSNSEKKVGVKN